MLTMSSRGFPTTAMILTTSEGYPALHLVCIHPSTASSIPILLIMVYWTFVAMNRDTIRVLTWAIVSLEEIDARLEDWRGRIVALAWVHSIIRVCNGSSVVGMEERDRLALSCTIRPWDVVAAGRSDRAFNITVLMTEWLLLSEASSRAGLTCFFLAHLDSKLLELQLTNLLP